MLVYLADLRYTTISVSPDTMPLGIGFLAAYANKILGNEIQVKLFAYPDHLMEALKDARPDVLGVTNYCWSYALHSRMLKYARGLYPGILTIMGGPNIALDQIGRERRLKQTDALDVYVVDEGEEAFATLLSNYLASDLKKDRLFSQPQISSMFSDPQGTDIITGPPALGRRTLEEIPSPYLTGLMDPFFDDALCPLIQTTRGCPFTCTFCVEGVSYMTKVNRFPLDRIKEELEYIGPHAGVGSALMISDSNFGMLPGDLQVAEAIHSMQERFEWPKYIWATTGKNKKESILAAIDVLDGTMRMTNSVQSMNQDVLANIKRTNIKLETYAGIQRDVQARGRQSYAEVIVALPGETLESFKRGIRQLLDAGAQQVQSYQLMLLDGTELSNQETRDKFGFRTKFRVLPRSFGRYEDEPVFEVEEVVVSTDTMSFQDYLECRKLQLVLDIYHREGLFQEFLGYITSNGVSISDFIMDLFAHLRESSVEVQELFSNYLQEAETELFDSPEQAREILSEKYQMVLDNEIGGNLVFKYSAIAWFQNLDHILRFAVDRATDLISRMGNKVDVQDRNINEELENIRRHHQAKTINIGDAETGLSDLVVELNYDIEAWKQGGYLVPLSEFSHKEQSDENPVSKEYVYYVSDQHAMYLKEKLRMHGTSTQAIGKLLSRVVLRDLQREIKQRAIV